MRKDTPRQLDGTLCEARDLTASALQLVVDIASDHGECVRRVDLMSAKVNLSRAFDKLMKVRARQCPSHRFGKR